jgi:hypothetical protein
MPELISLLQYFRMGWLFVREEWERFLNHPCEGSQHPKGAISGSPL